MTTAAGTSARSQLRSGTGAVSRSQQRARMPADVALILIGACFVLPLLWLVFASLDASAGDPPGKTLRMMIPAGSRRINVPLSIHGAAKFSTPDH